MNSNIVNTVILDLSVISLVNLTVNEVLTLLKIYLEKENKQALNYRHFKEDIELLQEKNFIRILNHNLQTERYVLRYKSYELIEKLIGIKVEKPSTGSNRSTEEKSSLTSLVKEIRARFKGYKIGAMGDYNSLTVKLKRWKDNNPSITDSQILEAVDKYIESHNGNFKYLQRADYFVYKQNNLKEESSRLSMYIDEIKEPKENLDWGTNII